MSTPSSPTRMELIAQIVRQLEGPTPLETIVDRVLERKPSRAKDPRSPIRGDTRLHACSLGIVFADLERKLIVPAQIAMRGMRFRHVVTEAEISRRMLLWDESDAVYLASPSTLPDFDRPDLQLIDGAGQAIAAERSAVPLEVVNTAGYPMLRGSGRKLAACLRQHQVKAGDSLLFTIEQFDPPRWRMEHEPQAQRDQAAIDRRNRELMDILFAMLENSPGEYIDMYAAVRSAFCQLSDPYGYPGDPWMTALPRDGRMRADAIGIVYAEAASRSIFDAIASFHDEYDSVEETSALPELPPLPEVSAQRIYTFKIGPIHRKSLWRRVEVLGAETLEGLNSYLVDLFKHDDDHLGGFWRIVSRGKGKRVREVELAVVEPYSGGDQGGEQRIADLNLAEGDALKWVYDFGDWHEYTLRLETVVDPQSPPDVTAYPRVVGANKPQLLYCAACQKRGKQTVARWCCWDCSNEQNETVLLCDECSRLPEHEEHYLEEWVY